MQNHCTKNIDKKNCNAPRNLHDNPLELIRIGLLQRQEASWNVRKPRGKARGLGERDEGSWNDTRHHGTGRDRVSRDYSGSPIVKRSTPIVKRNLYVRKDAPVEREAPMGSLREAPH